MRRRTLLTIVALVPAALSAQSSASTDPAIMISFGRIADIFGYRLVDAFDSIPANRYDYRPTPMQQTIGYIAQHFENANYMLCERFGAMKHSRAAKDSLSDSVKARWPKDTLVARVRASMRFCDAAIDSAAPLRSPTQATNLLLFETDLAEHYSQVAIYMRMLGMVPPSALPVPKRVAIDLPVSALSAYIGVYQVVPGTDLQVTMREGALFIRSTPDGATVRLYPESATGFFVKEIDAQVTFMRNARGVVSGLVFHQFGRDRIAVRRP